MPGSAGKYRFSLHYFRTVSGTRAYAFLSFHSADGAATSTEAANLLGAHHHGGGPIKLRGKPQVWLAEPDSGSLWHHLPSWRHCFETHLCRRKGEGVAALDHRVDLPRRVVFSWENPEFGSPSLDDGGVWQHTPSWGHRCWNKCWLEGSRGGAASYLLCQRRRTSEAWCNGVSAVDAS